MSKQEAWFNQTVTPNSGFGEFEANFDPILDSRLFSRDLRGGLVAEMRALKFGQFAAAAMFNFQPAPQARLNVLESAYAASG